MQPPVVMKNLSTFLTKAGADVNLSTTNTKITALMFAASNGHVKCVEALITAGADVNLCNSDGCTALIKAALKAHAKCVDVLITVI